MPTYAYHCESCEEDFDRFLPMSRCAEPQACFSCGQIAKKLVTPINFNLAGDDWPGKADRVSRQMRAKNAKLSEKQSVRLREQPPVSLVPNVDGERVDSWAEAQKLAASKGKDTTTYDTKVQKEKSTK